MPKWEDVVETTNLETNASLLLRLRNLEDQEAWNRFIERYGPEILRWCRGNSLQESDARDLTQEVLSKLILTMRTFEYDPKRGSFRGWLKTVTKNAVRDLGRKWEQRIMGSGDTTAHNFLLNLVATENLNSLEQKIEAQHEAELLAEAERKVRQRVQPKTWWAFQLMAVKHLPAKDAAKELDMPISEIYVSKCRVLKMLREEINQLNRE